MFRSSHGVFAREMADFMRNVDENKWMIIGGTAAGMVGLWFIKRKGRSIASWLCHKSKRNVNNGFRTRFNSKFVWDNGPPRPISHSHPIGAKNRTDAERSIDNFVISEGYEPYSVSTSARDNVGQRLYYCAKDLDLPYSNAKVKDKNVLRMIDVDYYADMEDWLWTGRPILLYTFVPDSVGGSVVEGVFHVKDDVVTVIYDGGGTYQHKLWDYNVDHFVIKGKVYSLMVKVDQILVPDDPQRRVICLTPTTWFFSVFNGLFGGSNRLKRRQITYGEANVITYTRTEKENSTCMVSLGVNGSPSCVNIKYQTLIGLCLRLQQAKHPNVSDVEKYLRNDKVEEAPILAPIIYAAWEGGWYRVDYKVVNKQVACGKASSAPHYQVAHPLVTEIGKPIGDQVWKPVITGGAILPCSSYNNDTQAVVGRIENIRNTANPKGVYARYLREFVTAFPCERLDPLSISEVIELQKRPAQRVRSEMAKTWVGRHKLTVKSFMKKESYQKISDPRNISTCTNSHTLNLSTYTYQAKKIFQRYKWFVPGRKPTEIVNAVQEFVMDTDKVYSTDYSRLDGTISPFLRKLERGVYMRLFNTKYYEELGKLLDDEISCKAVTATGRKYDPGHSRLSGSPLTTDGNTIIVAFVLYCAARRAALIREGEIDKIPGLVYGDDQLAKFVPEDVLVSVASELGLTLKVETAQMGEPLTYLSRIFVDAWSTKTTIQSPLRALSKMHLSCIRNVDPRIVARYKAEGYYTTDRLTPLISHYCLHIIGKTSDVTELHLNNPQLLRDANWWIYEFGSDATWPQEVSDTEVMERIVADHLSLEVNELRELCERVEDGDWTPLERELEVTVDATVTSSGDTTFVVRPKKKAGKGDKRGSV